jgi:hypothetical protein
MRECEACVALVGAFDAAAGPDSVEAFAGAFHAAREHLVDEHLAELPGYDEDCANCLEWRVLATDPVGIAPRVVPVLGREDLLHRAGHLLI